MKAQRFVRNLIIAFLTILAITAYAATEDFTTYTEVDPTNDITVTSSSISFTGLPRNADAYVYTDKGINHFDEDYTLYFDVNIATVGGAVGQYTYGPVVADYIGSYDDGEGAGAGDAHVCFFYRSGVSTLRMYARELNNGTTTSSSIVFPLMDTTYYGVMFRDDDDGAFGSLKCELFSDSDRTTSAFSISVNLTEQQDFRYLYGYMNEGDTNSEDSAGNFDNLEEITASTAVIFQHHSRRRRQ